MREAYTFVCLKFQCSNEEFEHMKLRLSRQGCEGSFTIFRRNSFKIYLKLGTSLTASIYGFCSWNIKITAKILIVEKN